VTWTYVLHAYHADVGIPHDVQPEGARFCSPDFALVTPTLQFLEAPVHCCNTIPLFEGQCRVRALTAWLSMLMIHVGCGESSDSGSPRCIANFVEVNNCVSWKVRRCRGFGSNESPLPLRLSVAANSSALIGSGEECHNSIDHLGRLHGPPITDNVDRELIAAS
jgi:hypothetical protein